MKFISRTTAATILIEEIDSAVPRKSAVSRRWSGCGSSDSGRSWPSAKPQAKGTRDAGERDADRRAADLAHQLEVGLHAGEQQQQQDAELRNGVDHGLLLGRRREQRSAAGRARAAEHRGAEQNAGQKLSHDRGLADRCHGLAKQAADHHQQEELSEKNDLGRSALGGERDVRVPALERCRARGARPGQGRGWTCASCSAHASSIRIARPCPAMGRFEYRQSQRKLQAGSHRNSKDNSGCHMSANSTNYRPQSWSIVMPAWLDNLIPLKAPRLDLEHQFAGWRPKAVATRGSAAGSSPTSDAG